MKVTRKVHGELMAARREKRAQAAAQIVYTITGGETGTDKVRHELSDHQDILMIVDARSEEVAIEIMVEDRATGDCMGTLGRFPVRAGTTAEIRETLLMVAGAWQLAKTMADTGVVWDLR